MLVNEVSMTRSIVELLLLAVFSPSLLAVQAGAVCHLILSLGTVLYTVMIAVTTVSYSTVPAGSRGTVHSTVLLLHNETP